MTETQTVDLAAWLTHIWDEEERLASQASPGPWHLNDEHSEVLAVDDIEVCTAFALSNNQLRWTARHIAAHDPESVLARIAADRKILEDYRYYEADYRANPTPTLEGQRFGLLLALAHLAEVYADRTGFREEWRP